MTEQELLKAIDEATSEQKVARTKMVFHQKAAIDAESKLISINIQKERLQEKLRVHLLQHPHVEETPRDREIVRLRQIMPDLLKKIK